jgi:hypothetical protein
MGALIPASEWLDFYLLSRLDSLLTRGSWNDFAGFCVAQSRWARLAGFEIANGFFGLCFTLPGETELGSAEEQPNEG